jgi:hypothetical protein
MSDISPISTTFIIFFTFILQYLSENLNYFIKRMNFFVQKKKKHRKTFQVQKKTHLN